MHNDNRKQRHFLSHTLIHLGAAFFVFVIAVLIASTNRAPENIQGKHLSATDFFSLGALNSFGTSSGNLFETNSIQNFQFVADSRSFATSTPIYVSFSVFPGLADCSGGEPRTRVNFSAFPAGVGSFTLSKSGFGVSDISLGEHTLPNGSYLWVGTPSAGYVALGDTSGTFQLNALCSSHGGIDTFAVETVATSSSNTSGNTVIAHTTSEALIPSGSLIPATTSTTFATSSSATISVSSSSNHGDTGIVPLPPTTSSPIITPPHIVLPTPVNSLPVMPTPEIMHTTSTHNTSSSVTTGVPTASSLKIFLDNQPVTDPVPSFNDRALELRLTLPKAKKVTFVAIDEHNVATQLDNAVIDDLLTFRDAYVWTSTLDTGALPDGLYHITAHVLQNDGTIRDVPAKMLQINHQKIEGVTLPQGVAKLMTPEERKVMLTRVTLPSLCATPEECRIFCAQFPDSMAQCVRFAQESVTQGTLTVPSLVDNITDERLLHVLSDATKRTKDIPDIITKPAELKSFCTDPTHVTVCANLLTQNDLATAEGINARKATMETARAVIQKVWSERIGTRPFMDSDGDGISDYDEVNIYHTNPHDADTNHNGIRDDSEILAHTNPLSFHATTTTGSGTSTTSAPEGEGVVMENPLVAGSVEPKLLTVADVAVLEVGIGAKGTSTAKKLTFSGNAPANSFVTLFIFSNPIVVSVKAGADGSWTYTLDKELPDGAHQVVSALTDAGGHILAKSTPLPFVKVAAAVSVGSEGLIPTQEAPSLFAGSSLYTFIIIMIALVGLALSVIGFIVHRKREEETPLS